MVLALNIKDREHVEKINKIASNAPFEVWVSTSTSMLDAKSLLGLYSLVGKRVNVVVEDNINPKYFSKLVASMS